MLGWQACWEELQHSAWLFELLLSSRRSTRRHSNGTSRQKEDQKDPQKRRSVLCCPARGHSNRLTEHRRAPRGCGTLERCQLHRGASGPKDCRQDA